MSHLYVATTHEPSSICCTATAAFTSPQARNLVVARGNVLEVFILNESTGSLQLLASDKLAGHVSGLEAVRLPRSRTDCIFILTDKKHYLLLSWDESKECIYTVSIGNMKIRNHMATGTGSKLFVDRHNFLIGAFVQDGVVKILPLGAGEIKDPIDLRLDILKPIDLQFLSGHSQPLICVLYEDERQMKHFRTYLIDPKDKECGNMTANRAWSQRSIDSGARFIIPVPAPLHGCLIVGESTITYYNNNKDVSQSVAISGICSNITAFAMIDPSGSRYLITDDFGKVFVLVLVTREMAKGSVELLRLSIDPIVDQKNTTSVAHSIEYLGGGFVFLGSCFGDSQLARLSSERTGQQIEVLSSIPNIGPIVDMVVIEGDKQGQNYIVTCSGGFGAGSLRVIRSGIGVDEQAFMDLEGLKAVWSLKGGSEGGGGGGFDKYLVQSYIGETRLLVIESNEMGEIEDPGAFVVEQETLFCANMDGGLILQATPSCLLLMQGSDFSRVFMLSDFGSQIVLATANQTQVVVASSGGGLACYELDVNSQSLIFKASYTFQFDIACMSFDISLVTADTTSNILAISLWTENSVILVKLPTPEAPDSLSVISKVEVQSDSQVRSVLLLELGRTKYCLVGSGDGVLFSYVVDSQHRLHSRKKYLLGTRPISLAFFRNNDEPCVFVSSDRPTIIYCSNDKLLFSGVNTAETLTMTPFNSEMFSNSFCLCTDAGLLIGSIDSIQKLYIRSVDIEPHVDESSYSSSYMTSSSRSRKRCSPRRICYHGTSGTFAVIVEEHSPSNYSSHFVYFYDEAKFDYIDKVELDVGEVGTSCSSCFINCKDSSGNSEIVEYIIIGTMYQHYDSSDSEPTKGRLLVFHVNIDPVANKKAVDKVADFETKGSVFSVAAVDGNLVIAVNNTVSVYLCTHPNPANFDLHFSTSPALTHNGHILALYIKSHGNYVIVGDVLRSMSLLEFNPEEKRLVECARDFNANYMRAVDILGNDSSFFFGADDSGNIFTLKRKVNAGGASPDAAKLDVAGEFHLGDSINVIRRGSLVTTRGDLDSSSSSSSSSSAMASSDEVLSSVTGTSLRSSAYLYGTVTGAIGTALVLDEPNFKFYSCLERAIKSVDVTATSCLDHGEWRKFTNDRRSSAHRNIVDGDMVQKFLDLSKDNQRDAVKKLNEDYYAVSLPMSTATSNSSISSSFGLASVLSSDAHQFTIEDVVNRVEEIGRLH